MGKEGLMGGLKGIDGGLDGDVWLMRRLIVDNEGGF